MRRHALPIGLGLIALVLALGLRVLDPGPIRQARLAVFDIYQQLKPREYDPRAPVRVVDIDEESLARHGQFPWPRTLVARMVDRLREIGALAIAFDIVFAEPDRTSPAQIVPTWPEGAVAADIAESLRLLPDHDQLLAESFARAPVVTGMVLLNQPNDVRPLPKATFVAAGSSAVGLVPPYSGAIKSLDVLEQSAQGNGSFSLGGTTGGIIRQIPLIQSLDGHLYPTLAIEALRVAQGARSIITRATDASGEIPMGEAIGLSGVKVGRLELPTTATGEFWVYYTQAVPERLVPAWKLLDPATDPAELARLLQGYIVLIGTSAQGLLDLRSTPLNPFEPGVLIHAQAAEQMILGQFLERPPLADGAEAIAVAVIGLLLCFFLPRLGSIWSAVIAVGIIVAGIAASWFAFSEAHLLFDPVYPGIAIILVYFVLSLAMFLRAERERGRVRSAFSRYLAPALVDRLAEHPEQLVLGGEMRELTLMFSDIRGFTTIAEGMGPRELTSLINSFLTPMTDIILESGGTIDKYMGDAIMAFWNAPLSDPQHMRHGVLAALEMRQKLRALNAEWRRQAEAANRPFRQIAIGVGLNSGEVCVGNMGSEQRFDYSVLGDAVNLASRLEGQSKLYGVDIVVSESTLRGVPDLAVIELDLIRVKGKLLPVRIFAVLGDGELAGSDGHKTLGDRHRGLLEAYRGQRWDEAEATLAECRTCSDGRLTVLYDLYADRIGHFRQAPPNPDWDGVYVAESK